MVNINVNIFGGKKILRYPRLDTVLMVEEAIKKSKKYKTKKELLKSLPKGIMYQTFNLILDYLEYSKKILIDKDGSIIWIWDPERVKKIKEKGLVIK